MPADKLATVLDFDRVLGLGLAAIDNNEGLFLEASSLPAAVNNLLIERQQAREEKDWERADYLRREIMAKGYAVSDSAEGQKINKAA